MRAIEPVPDATCAVDVWRVPLQGTHDLTLLSAPERARHQRYVNPVAAQGFAAARSALRRLLAARLGVDAGSLRIEAGPQGKPFLPDHPATRFNVTHAGGLALIALCDACEVGIDLEWPASFATEGPLASIACNAAERRWLDAHPRDAARALGRLWTRKEALLKALGTGLVHEPARVDLSTQIEVSRGETTLDAADGASRLAWADLAPLGDAFGAVAAVVPLSGTTIAVHWRDDRAFCHS